jgi:2-amino-4-hydroxy-6-hydroxymethyldihydropteridine diphosphokinase/dihydropteroate synthase
MLIIGLGSNIGDRLEHLRKALRFLQNVPGLIIQQVSPVYISDALLPKNADSSWNTPYLNAALRCHTTLSPQELLDKTKAIEKQCGRDSSFNWSPRIIDIDILAWDDLIKYEDKLHIPHEHLHERPFALLPLKDVAPFWIYPLPGPHQGKTAIELANQWNRENMPFHTHSIAQRIDGPALVGIVNITPDSFSDGGKYVNPDVAVQKIEALVKEGADVIDLGAEATGPKAQSIDPTEEWQRLEPVLSTIMQQRGQMLVIPKICIDTRNAWVAGKALALGVDWINDVSGLDDPKMRATVSNNACDVVFMHHLGVPASQSTTIPLSEDPVAHVYQWAEKRIQELNLPRERLIFDVGIGYGKTPEQSLLLIKNISVFKNLGVKLFLGHSRKSFLTCFTQEPAAYRDIETIAVSLYLARQNIDFLRVHNIDQHARALKVSDGLSFGDATVRKSSLNKLSHN